MKHPAAPVDVPACSCCGEPAVIYQPVSRRHLCGIHLVRDVEKRVASTINEAGQIHAGDRIAVALSGGKDSTALLVILSRLLPAWPGADLVAITVDEGIAGYRTDTIRAAEALTGRLGVDHRIVSFRDLVGADLDTLLAGRETEACTICGILRKKALTDAARTAGATAIATGHNLDDEAQSMLMNAFRGDLPRLVRNTGTGRSALFLPRIKPLAAVTEKEIAAYLFVQGLFSVLPECPYTRYALRAEVRSLLAGLEDRHPGTMQHLADSKKSIERYCAGTPVMESLHHCRECGDPCSGEICQVCRLRHSLGK
ncbi:MAG: TIGR00269 family protein [Methanoregula sp.]|uniref:TIGR00269 family protein n=2 Tax=Methanoregula sp. TaxID=2052170 RepID=UPI003BE9F52F